MSAQDMKSLELMLIFISQFLRSVCRVFFLQKSESEHAPALPVTLRQKLSN